MNQVTQEMRKIAKELLEEGKVQLVIGWEKGSFGYNSNPVFITSLADVDKLIWDDFCSANLAKYLLDHRYSQDKIAIFLKGCDSRGINRLLQDKQIQRENLYLIGIPCPGMKNAKVAREVAETDKETIQMEDKCLYCTHHNPVVYDNMLGDKVNLDEIAATGEAKRFDGVDQLEQMTFDERYDFWQKTYARCIRCYACRNVCPSCNCTECCFDLGQTWLERDVIPTGNQVYGIVRALHVAGRCIECGECERVCPMDIPIMKVNRKMAKDIEELFGSYEAGLDTEVPPPLGHYEVQDPDEFE